jgi:hypothetical protein
MQTYKELKELAVMCAYNARTSTSTPVAIELWNMAKEYQRRAAQLGSLPDMVTRRLQSRRSADAYNIQRCADLDVGARPRVTRNTRMTPKKVIRSQPRNDCAVARFPNGRPGRGPLR